ncbi:Na+-translocating NADH-quinone reductase subunit F [Yersinia aleksiciae]|nr:hypothetical protein [Yersinia aleksiciae]CFQ44757.1 Na+-translocating NADH-quinone reductase subunit F [Yersinia aleksiciae]
MVEELISTNDQRPIHIYWGMPESKLFYSDIANKWAAEYPNIQCAPVVSGEGISWHGQTGFVHKAVINDFSELGKYSVYACGSLAMISAAHQEFVQYGLAEDQFFSDAFVPSK